MDQKLFFQKSTLEDESNLEDESLATTPKTQLTVKHSKDVSL